MDRQQLDDTVLDLVKGQSAIAATLEETQKRIDEHFDGVNKRLDTLNGKVARHEQELHQQKVDHDRELHEQKVEVVKHMAEVVQTIKTINTQLATVTTQSNKHETFITASKAEKRTNWKIATISATLGAGLFGLLPKVPAFFAFIQHLFTK